MMLKQVKINKSLKGDAIRVFTSIYRYNSKGSIGYLFNPSENRKEVACGMFCNSRNEIIKEQWTYFIDFKTPEIVYKIV